MVNRVMPGATLQQVFWEIPFCMLGFLIMQERRQAGVQGIGRPEKSEELWKAFQKKMAEMKKDN